MSRSKIPVSRISKDPILASSRRCKVHCACNRAFLTNPGGPLDDWPMVPVRGTMTGQKRGGKDFRSLRSVAREKIARGAAGPARWTLWVVPVRIPGCLGFARPTVLTIAGWGVRNRWWQRRRRRRQPLPPLRDQSSCASTTPGFDDGIASFTPALSLPHLTCGRERRAFSLSRFEALVRRFVRLGESTCSTASRVRSEATLLPSVVGMKFTIGTNPGSATISTAASAPTTYAARSRGNRNPGSFVHFVNTSREYVPPGIGVFIWKILFTKFSLPA